MKKLLITGAGGFLGSHLVEQAKSKFEVFGWSYNSPIDLPNEKSFYFDLTDLHSIDTILQYIQPDYIIHTAAISSENGCKENLEEAETVNVEVVEKLAKYSKVNFVKLIFTSTDLVFDGENAPYSTIDSIQPKLVYAELKRKAELLLADYQNTCVVRLPLLYGIGLGEKKGLLQNFIDHCKAGKTQNLFQDEFRTPVFVRDIADFLLELLTIESPALLHLGGKERISRYNLGLKFAQHLNLNEGYLKAIKRADIGMEDRPADTSMNSDEAYLLGFIPQKLDVALHKIQKSIEARK